MRVRIAMITALLATALMTAGCTGARELDERAYVLTIGADVADGGRLELTFEVAIPRVLAGEGGTKTDPTKAVNFITVTAPTLAEGRNLLNSSTARPPVWSHVATFVVGEELARKGVAGFLSSTMRFREFRGAIDIVVVEGKAKDFMRQNSPEEILASRWFQAMLLSAEETSYFLRGSLHEFYVRLKSGSGAPFATLMGINSLQEEGRPSAPAAQGDKVREYLPKGVPREGGNPATVVGVAVFKGDRLAGMLPSEETRALSMLLGKYANGYMVVDDPLVPGQSVNVDTRLARKPAIDIALRDGRAVINVNVFLEGYITSITSGINYESREYKGRLEWQISASVQQTMLQMLRLTQRWGADVADFGYHLRSRYATDQEFKELHWDALYPDAEISVAVKTELRRAGLMRKTMPLRTVDSGD